MENYRLVIIHKGNGKPSTTSVYKHMYIRMFNRQKCPKHNLRAAVTTWKVFFNRQICIRKRQLTPEAVAQVIATFDIFDWKILT